MAMRIRMIDGVWVALCAAKSVPKEGDIYLDDDMDHAVRNKLAIDLNGQWGLTLPVYEDLAALAEVEESNNPNREWWDSVYSTD